MNGTESTWQELKQQKPLDDKLTTGTKCCWYTGCNFTFFLLLPVRTVADGGPSVSQLVSTANISAEALKRKGGIKGHCVKSLFTQTPVASLSAEKPHTLSLQIPPRKEQQIAEGGSTNLKEPTIKRKSKEKDGDGGA